MIEGSSNVMFGGETMTGGGTQPRPSAMGAAPNHSGATAASGAAGGSPAAPSAATSTASASSPATPTTPPATDNEHVYVINAQLAAPGGVPLGNEQVVLVKAGTDERIAGPFTTDADGGFATLVPENLPYDVQILDTGHPGGTRSSDDEIQAHLHVGVFENGMPVAGEAVTIVRPDGSQFAMTLDADGMLDLVADRGEHQISVRGENFVVHTLTGANLADGGSHYELALSPPQYDFETARANRYHPDRDDEGVS